MENYYYSGYYSDDYVSHSVGYCSALMEDVSPYMYYAQATIDRTTSTTITTTTRTVNEYTLQLCPWSSALL